MILDVPKMPQNIRPIYGYTFAVGGVALISALSVLFNVHGNAITAALALLLIVLIVATLFGSRPALVASLLCVVSFNFFFLPPYYTWHIAAPENWVAFAAFTITALIAGQLSSYARRRAAEAEARRMELEGLYRDLQLAFEKASQAEALRQSDQLKSALLDAVTHDLRTPLTSIKASVTTLMEDAKAEGQNVENDISLDADGRKEFLEIINEETDRLDDFIGEMVDLAKIEAGKLVQRKTPADISEIISEAAERAKARLNGHRLTVEVGSDMRALMVDATSLTEVVYILLDNAAKYSSQNSEIRVKAIEGEGDLIELAVEDKGRGIKPEVREQVFDKFYRGSENAIHSTASGLGLGLSIARGIVESQGGKIWIEDGQDGFKTRFVFRVPVGNDHEAVVLSPRVSRHHPSGK
jgi:two-component system sensor histidine kinase KdpD